MSGHELKEALREGEPGDLITDFRYVSLGVAVRGLREAKVPESNPLSAPDNKAVIVTNGTNHPHGDLAIGLINIHDGQAELGIETRRPGIESNVHYIRGALTVAMTINEVKAATIKPQNADVPVDVLEQIGFHPEADTDVMRFDVWAA